MLSDERLIERCLQNDQSAQRQLYNKYAPRMWGVCLRFAKNRMVAEDLLQEGFIRVFVKLNQYTHEGSFEGWIRRTMINTAINYFKKNFSNPSEYEYDEVTLDAQIADDALDNLSVKELVNIIQELPEGYRIVFNLHALEGYTHKEISEMLDISENTSKSQLSRARGVLQDKLSKKLNK